MEEALTKLDEIRAFLSDHTPKSTPASKTNDFDLLVNLLHKDAWPEATPADLIVDSESEESKQNRAEGICDLMIEQPMKDARFLDFGCGEGHAVAYAASQGATAFGYDIRQTGNLTWESENPMLTTDFSKIADNGPYDIILIYDVVDHIELESIVSVMEKIKLASGPTTRLYVRTHPWCSRHGGHHYPQLNKAFIHLVFTEEELKDLDLESMPTTRVVHPIGNYRRWWKDGGFKVIHEDITRTAVEPFFKKNPVIRDRITKNWQVSKDETAKKWPAFQLEQSFLDYVLESS